MYFTLRPESFILEKIIKHSFFFEGLCKKEEDRVDTINKLLGGVPYLNGGLFLPTEIEMEYGDKIAIENEIFCQSLNYPLSQEISHLPVLNLLESKKWTVDEKTGDIDELNPEILGFIFEKRINNKSLGAIYTPEVITKAMGKMVLVGHLNKGRKSLNKKFISYKSYRSVINDKNINSQKENIKILNKLKILDPACGSGHFLVDMLFLLEQIYVSYNYQINPTSLREKLILNNLFGVDILTEAIEITKLRLFLAIAETYTSIAEIKPLPNIEFYLRSGDSIIGFIGRKSGDLSDYFSGSIESLLKSRNSMIKEFKKSKLNVVEIRRLILKKTEDLQEFFTKKVLL